jgi:hypothetical protein
MTGARQSMFLGISALGSRLPTGASALPRAHADTVKPVERLALPPPPSRDEVPEEIVQIEPPSDDSAGQEPGGLGYFGFRDRRRRPADAEFEGGRHGKSPPQDVSAQGANHAYRRRVVANHGLDRATGRLINLST